MDRVSLTELTEVERAELEITRGLHGKKRAWDEAYRLGLAAGIVRGDSPGN